jgi:peptide/nickel transport system permease protein
VHNVPVSGEILAHLPVTLALTLMSLVISVVIGIPAGVLAAARRGRGSDAALRIVSLAGMAVPTFVASVTAVLFFSLYLPSVQLFSSIDFRTDFWGAIEGLLLPSAVLSLAAAATIMRYTRGAMLEVMREQYIAMARAKGAGPWRVLLKHGLRTALLPVVTASGLIAAQLISGVVVVEQVFGLPGLGQLMLSAISSRDYTLVQGAVIVVGAMVVLINLTRGSDHDGRHDLIHRRPGSRARTANDAAEGAARSASAGRFPASEPAGAGRDRAAADPAGVCPARAVAPALRSE